MSKGMNKKGGWLHISRSDHAVPGFIRRHHDLEPLKERRGPNHQKPRKKKK